MIKPHDISHNKQNSLGIVSPHKQQNTPKSLNDLVQASILPAIPEINTNLDDKPKRKQRSIEEIFGIPKSVKSKKGGRKSKQRCVVFRSDMAAAALSVSTDGINNRNRILLSESKAAWSVTKSWELITWGCCKLKFKELGAGYSSLSHSVWCPYLGIELTRSLRLPAQRLCTIFLGGAMCIVISIFVCSVWAGQDLRNLVASNSEKIANSQKANTIVQNLREIFNYLLGAKKDWCWRGGVAPRISGQNSSDARSAMFSMEFLLGWLWLWISDVWVVCSWVSNW
ncbi:hypothetical protein Acr_08g0014760 [Actinidia rufa]|uniref:Uncharacterized protein n=1 Tax=Actinidia rufa TaxID=165716 RepID=A0A7J0F319_9ERIC|nr:hypothetical protein Acr_08g0014760 [Actinidia rufa]